MTFDFDRRLGTAFSFTPVNLSDDSDVMLIDLTAQYTEDDGAVHFRNERTLRYCRGFHSNVDAVLSFIAPGSPIVNSIDILPGRSYDYGIARFRETGSSRISNGDLVAFR